MSEAAEVRLAASPGTVTRARIWKGTRMAEWHELPSPAHSRRIQLNWRSPRHCRRWPCRRWGGLG